MSLAQVVYQMSTDADFASQLSSSPETALAKRGLQLSKEELAFLLSTRTRGELAKSRIITMADEKAKGWAT